MNVPLHTHEALAQTLIDMAKADQNLLNELFATGELPSEQYHPKMRALHEQHVQILQGILNEHGWPSIRLVGKEGAKAAWLIAQHAVSHLSFMSSCVALLKDGVANNEVEGWQLAFLEDRVLTLQGKAQEYGTQFDVDEQGWPTPFPIANPERVNERRQALGLNTLEERLEQLRQREQARRKTFNKH